MKLNPVSISRVVVMLVLASIMRPANAQEKHAFTAQQAVDYAMKNSINVKNILLDYKLQEQTNREITSAAFPQLDARAGAVYNPNIAVQAFPNFIAAGTYGVLQQEGVKNASGQPITAPGDFGLIEAQFGTKYTANVGVDLSQILFDGQVFVGLQARETSLQWAKKNVEVTEVLIKANVVKVYYQLVAGKTQLDLLDANIERLSKLQHDTREMYKNGFSEKLDVDKLTVQIANLETEKKKVQNNIYTGYLGLKMLLGMPVKDEVVLTDTLSDSKLKDGILESSTYNYSDRKEFQYAELGKKLREYDLKRYKLSQIPTVRLTSSYSKNAMRNKADFFGKGDWYTFSNVGLNISVPLFHGFSTRSKIETAKLNLEKTSNDMENLKLTIDQEVAIALANFKTAIENMDYQKQNMKLAIEVFDQTQKKFQAGLGSNTEINTAQTDLKSAESNYITALQQAIIARVDYMKAIGKL
ncbi:MULTISPECIES: TolC family protein [Niastella]|uniref:TolC family protein n=1 Tax=Niastella soli TaxID=2821487 RepID=A0ABS3YN66_9BACT|nr:TolC family protein [Niastella soli]MBO9199258.1 TolC family protein [Niastella soli]